MARSSLRLPNIQELSKQQSNALDLPLEGQHLVVGGPGTGKSVVALLRARRLAEENKNYLFLVYNVLLERSCYALGGTEIRAATWKQWFKKNFEHWFDCPLPIRANDRGGYAENWYVILAKCQEKKDIDTSLYLVIDEGQDMPPEFYQALIALGFMNFYVVADQNQRITEHNSSIYDIRKSLAIDVHETCELTRNYRNSLPVARLSQHFCTNDPGSPRPDLPNPGAGDKIPYMMRYGEDAAFTLPRIARQILMTYDRNTDKLTCIVTPNDVVRENFCQILRQYAQELSFDHGPPAIQTYSSTEKITSADTRTENLAVDCPLCGALMIRRRNSYDGAFFWGCSTYPACNHTKDYVSIDFKNGGIAVINQQSIKGLEFDLVYLADIDRFFDSDTDVLKKKFYVMTSRARDNVFLLRTGDISPKVEQIIPKDETILQRR